MKKDSIESLNIEAGACTPADKQSTADVTIHAVNDPNTKDVDERTECNFQCQKGYFDEAIGDKIPFECEPNPDRTKPTGLQKTAPTPCKGVCVICVLTFSIALYSGRMDASVCNHSSPIFFTTIFCDRVLQRKHAQ